MRLRQTPIPLILALSLAMTCSAAFATAQKKAAAKKAPKKSEPSEYIFSGRETAASTNYRFDKNGNPIVSKPSPKKKKPAASEVRSKTDKKAGKAETNEKAGKKPQEEKTADQRPGRKKSADSFSGVAE